MSPSDMLALRLRTRTSLTEEQWKAMRQTASSCSLRLPVLTFQMLIRFEERRKRTALSAYLNDHRWQFALKYLRHKGLDIKHIEHWAWILAGDSSDARLERFFSTDMYKPIFLLRIILRSEETFKDRKAFLRLLEYFSKHYVRLHTSRAEGFAKSVDRSFDHRLNISIHGWLSLLRRLVHHCLRIWPESLVTVAQLTVKFLATLPASSNHGRVSRNVRIRHGYAARCWLFNRAMCLFGKKAVLNPLANTQHNWAAQKVLLSFSTSLDRQLLLSNITYTSVRATLAALEKNRDEEKVAIRSRKTWPPYRQAWDGIDERRRPEDDLSRSIMAGNLQRQTGYYEGESQLALGVIGGAMPGQSPTVQTRSVEPKAWKGNRANLILFSTWAAQVLTTRSAQEAWRSFNTPPRQGLKPNFQVYAEMFEKLFAAPVTNHSAVPGTVKEVFPPHNANLTAFETARLEPPSVEQLYDTMLKTGNRPVGKCLKVLIVNAQSHETAMQYLRDGSFRHYADVLSLPVADISPVDLENISLPVFNAYIGLLCRMSATDEKTLITSSKGSPGDSHPISTPELSLGRAIELTSLRLPPNSPESRTYKAPWHQILRTLVNRKTSYASHGPERTEMFATVLHLFDRVREQMGLDKIIFEHLCLATGRMIAAVLKVSKYLSFELQAPGRYRVSNSATRAANLFNSVSADDESILRRARLTINSAFDELIGPGKDYSGELEEAPAAPISARQIFRYMWTLSLFDDIDGMVGVIRWILQSCEVGRLLESAKVPGSLDHRYIDLTLTHFRNVVDGRVPVSLLEEFDEALQKLQEKGVPWLLPEAVQESEELTMSRSIARGWSRIAGKAKDENHLGGTEEARPAPSARAASCR